MARLRADLLLVARGLAESREAAQRLIAAGRVRTGTLTLVKASQMLDEAAPLEVLEPERYVSRGGYKLEAALAAFGVDPTGRVCLDLGASTGGFTDCLLQHGATAVIAVDVGRAQLHQRLREDPRVVLMEGVNARELPELPFTIHDSRFTIETSQWKQAPLGNIPVGSSRQHDERPTANRESQIVNRESSASLFVADLSFISLTKVLPAVALRLPPATEGVVLLKPQFEAGPKDVPRGGVIRDEAVLERVKAGFVSWLSENGWRLCGIIPSPIKGGDGNTEFLVHLGSPERDATDA